MDYNKQTKNLLSILKKLGWNQKRIEQQLKYSNNYISQQLSRNSVGEKMYDRINDLYNNVMNDKVSEVIKPDISAKQLFVNDGGDHYQVSTAVVNKEVLANEANISSIQGGIKLNYLIGLVAELQEAVIKGKKATAVASRVQELVQFDYQQVVLKMQI